MYLSQIWEIIMKICETINPIENGSFWRSLWMEGGEQKGPPPENLLYISYNDTVILYLRKIQKTNKSQDLTPEFCWYQNFLNRKQQLL